MELPGRRCSKFPPTLRTHWPYPPDATRFEAFPPSVERDILEWIGSAKKAETRVARVAETARLAHENQRANPCRIRAGRFGLSGSCVAGGAQRGGITV